MSSFVIEGYDNLRIIHAPTGIIIVIPFLRNVLLLFSVKFMKGIIHRATFIFVMKNSQMDYKTQPLID